MWSYEGLAIFAKVPSSVKHSYHIQIIWKKMPKSLAVVYQTTNLPGLCISFVFILEFLDFES